METTSKSDLWGKASAWLTQRRVDWRFAVRVTLAAGLSYGIAQALHIPEPFWAVITAVIVARSNLGGSLRSGADRLFATLTGAGLGVLASLLRPLAMPELALVVIVVAPLALLTAVRPEFRAGLVAGVIVLHAGALSGSPVGAALLRVADIALGAVIAILVARFILPAHALRNCHEHSARALKHLADLLALLSAPRGAVSRERIEGASNRARRAWRAAGRAANEARAERMAGKPAGAAPFQLVRELSRVHSDIGVIGRTLHHAVSGDTARDATAGWQRISQAFRAITQGTGQALLAGGAIPSLAAFDAAVAESPLPAATAGHAALAEMLRVLRSDLTNLLALVEQQRPVAA